jgi:hypothetical protein
MSSLDDDVLDDLLYGCAGDAEDHGGSSDGDAEPDCTAPRLHATERQGLDIGMHVWKKLLHVSRDECASCWRML